MDVTPRELRDTEIKEAFRGYNRDDVDELLERAAATIEGLSERMRQLSERAAGAQQAAPQPAAAAPTQRSREMEETLQRTLFLAQKTADEAVADAQQRARKLIDDSETKARTLVTEAESTARRLAEGERRRLEGEIQDLAARREALQSDVEALEQFESEYRQRLRATLESELDAISKSTETSLPEASRPTLHDVDVPPVREPLPPAAPAPPVAPAPAAAAASPAPESVLPGEPYAELAPDEPAIAAPEWGPEGALAPDEPSEEVGGEALAAYVADEPIEAEVLDDDAFFASLREAVRDDGPLGPRQEQSEAEFYDDEVEGEDEAGGKRRFRRRR